MPAAYVRNGYYIMLAKQVYHTARPYIILRKQYIIILRAGATIRKNTAEGGALCGVVFAYPNVASRLL